jgi:hypothetical protein
MTAVNCVAPSASAAWGYVMAVRANHTLTAGAGRTLTAAQAMPLIPARAWHRMPTGAGTKGTRHND